jgi:hypothetical protein
MNSVNFTQITFLFSIVNFNQTDINYLIISTIKIKITINLYFQTTTYIMIKILNIF